MTPDRALGEIPHVFSIKKPAHTGPAVLPVKIVSPQCFWHDPVNGRGVLPGICLPDKAQPHVAAGRAISRDLSVSFWGRFSRTAERLFQPVEDIFYVAVVKNVSRLLDRIDPLSHRIEGTLFKKILQVTIFPLFMTATLAIGFALVRNGLLWRASRPTIGMFLVYGAMMQPLERLNSVQAAGGTKSPDARRPTSCCCSATGFSRTGLRDRCGSRRLPSPCSRVVAGHRPVYLADVTPIRWCRSYLLLTINDFFPLLVPPLDA